MVLFRDILNFFSVLITLFLLGYGFARGYTFLELSLNNVYFVFQIIIAFLNIFSPRW